MVTLIFQYVSLENIFGHLVPGAKNVRGVSHTWQLIKDYESIVICKESNEIAWFKVNLIVSNQPNNDYHIIRHKITYQ